jgi:hypothetical protein
LKSSAVQSATFVPIGEDVARHAAVERAEPVHVEELVGEEAGGRLQPHLLDRLERRALEPVIALRLAGERMTIVDAVTVLGDVRGIAADAIHHHQRPFLERADRKRAIGVGDVMRDLRHLVGARAVERIGGGLLPLLERKNFRHVLPGEALFQFADREHIAIAHHEIDILEGDAFRLEAIVDHFLVEAGGVLVPRDSLFGDGEGDLAVAQQAGAHVVVVGINAENIAVTFGH